ncbi:MAG TPA: hypothetical protein VFG74_15190 [Miltoncostaeaceae bacterium]|nr:hypothetical protein [Miltoncostaeaceae bacterium]
MTRRAWILLAFTAACAVAAVAVVALSASAPTGAGTVDDPQAVTLPSAPYVVFRDLDRAHPEDRGRVAVLPLDDLDGPRVLAGVACERVYFSVAGGLCLEQSGRFPVRYRATVLDPRLQPVRSIPVPGVPSRTRVSADGRWGTTTTFVSGHSYAELGAFSTHATIIDMATGRTVIDNLEEMPVTRDGAPMESVDHNLWGVTFAPDRDTFYATLATRGTTYLVRGTISGRRLEVLHENVECPSVSPDGTRIAYKKRTGDYALWHVTVLDLATMRETSLAELDPIDDQIEWLDDRTVLYHNGGGISAVPADGSGAPRVFLPDAGSPSVVHPAS